MNFKLKREEYYNEDYILNEQELKGNNNKYLIHPCNLIEFMMPIVDPYWVVKTRAYLLDIPFLGEKSNIQQNSEIFLFNLLSNNTNNTQKFQKLFYSSSSNEFKSKSILDLYEKKFGFREDNYSQYNIGKIIVLIKFFLENLKKCENLPGFKKINQPIYTFIPELKLMKKFLSYPEMYCVLSKLADPQMVFINMFKENPKNNLISGIVYFPYTPSILENPNINTEFITNLSKYLGINCNYNYTSESEKIKILKQKLMDAYYLVEDSEDIHGITPCLNSLFHCDNIASFFCENNMCKNCCEKSRKKEFCVIHDDMVNYHRKKMQEILEFELRKNFDRTRTIRITVRQRITKFELRNSLEEKENYYDINWDNVEFIFRKGIEKIQYIYLQCNTNESARRLYDDRSQIIKKLEKYDLNITSLMENVESILQKVNLIESSGLLVVPCSSLISNNKKIPKKSERNKIFTKLIESSLQIDKSEYMLTNCRNLINGEYSYDNYIIEFKNKSICDKFYNMQPYLDSIIFHKLNHLTFFPLLNNRFEKFQKNCMNCIITDKSKTCKFDLCSDCCARQSEENIMLKNSKIICPCSISLREEFLNIEVDHLNIRFKCKICNQIDQILFDEKCFNSTKLCKICCTKQILPTKICTLHSNKIRNVNSIYSQENKFSSPQFNFEKFITDYQLNLSLVKLKLNNNLKNGDFIWFRPIGDTNLTRLMLDMNKELQIVMDKSNHKREVEMTINDKMYKMFAFQTESILKKDYNFNNTKTEDDAVVPFKTSEGFDYHGDFYIDYEFSTEDKGYYPDFYVEALPERLQSLDIKANNKEILEISTKLSNSFHLVLYGLDIEKFTTTELFEEIFEEMKSASLRIEREDIILIDEQSIISKI